MRPISENTVIQIDVTNVCFLACQGCTRHVGHHRKPYFMDLETVRKAIASLEGCPSRVGIMGGEPAMHPQFLEILAMLREMVPDKSRREYWTAGWKWHEYKDAVLETFLPERIAYNSHEQLTGKHKPLLVSIEETVEDPELRRLLIENCPYQSHWSASITPKGCFPCEVAGSLDWLFDGPGGWPIEPGWWKRGVDTYGWMVDTLCQKCSGAIPMESRSDGRGGRDGPTVDVVSPGNLLRLREVRSPKVQRGHIEVQERPFTLDEIRAAAHLNPREFRDFVAHKPEDVKTNVA